MLPPSSPPHVHFEDTCIVIPEITENSVIHFEKRSYVLPSWRRLRADPDTTQQESIAPPIINIRLPSLSRKHRRVPSAERGAPLQPCLRHSHSLSCSNSEGIAVESGSDSFNRPPPSPAASSVSSHSHRQTTAAIRRASLNSPIPEDRVPLRECCTACIESFNKGLQQDYREHWSKGAQRRRRMSESDNPSCSSGPSSFLTRSVKVDEIESKKPRRSAHVPPKLSPALLEHLCADDDESMLFPLPSPRRTGTPTNGTPLNLSPAATPPEVPSPQRTPSPNSVTKSVPSLKNPAIMRSKPLPLPPPSTAETGRDILARYPDVDMLPSTRRSVSESTAYTVSRRSPKPFGYTGAPRMFGW